MQFGILGPLEITTEPGGTVALGGARARAPLAVLLLHANELVSAERLAVALSSDDAPPGAIKAAQVHVSRLRKALADGAIVETTPGGYRLRVAPGEIDAERFDELVDEGRRALADGEPQLAASSLREALGLWRGPPLSDLAHKPFAAAEIRRLEERRLAATELAIEGDLAAGRHGDVVGELEALVAEHPLRERLHAQRMLALYRRGRRAEAFKAFRNARRLLVEQIGVEPGAAAAPHARGDPAPRCLAGAVASRAGARARCRRRAGDRRPRQRADVAARALGELAGARSLGAGRRRSRDGGGLSRPYMCVDGGRLAFRRLLMRSLVGRGALAALRRVGVCW
jgi:DNA-binding SARP family transcriptional activator